VRAIGGPWFLGRGYGSASYVWNTAGNGATDYQLDVWVREKGTTANEQALNVSSYTLGAALACAAPGLGASPTSPQMVGTPVTFTASSTTCSQPTYLLWVKAASGGTWILARNFTTNPVYNWKTTGDGKTTLTL
jgi:hypothetical protein